MRHHSTWRTWAAHAWSAAMGVTGLLIGHASWVWAAALVLVAVSAVTHFIWDRMIEVRRYRERHPLQADGGCHEPGHEHR